MTGSAVADSGTHEWPGGPPADGQRRFGRGVRRGCWLLVLAAALVGCSDPEPAAERWYDEGQVVRGEGLYQRYCAQCHGVAGEGAEDWRQRDEAGRTGPPPLNGTGHTWHHAKAELHHFIGHGLGPGMPPWRAVLSDEETTAVIAYLQHWWPDEIYEAWLRYDARFRESGAELGDEPLPHAHPHPPSSDTPGGADR